MTTYTYRNIAKTSAYSLCLIALVSSSSLQAVSPLDQEIESSRISTNTLKPASQPVSREIGQEVKRYNPLIISSKNGTKRVSQFLKNIQPTLLRWNELSYSMVKGGGTHLKLAVEDQEALEQEGWSFRGFYGFEGRNNELADLSGLVAYNKRKALLTVVFHGTATVEGQTEGWDTNFDATPINGIGFSKNDFTYTLNNLPGKKHQGFVRKYAPTREQIKDHIFQYISQMNDEERENLRIVFTGHSQGAALGALALHDTALNYGKEIFGSDFNNTLHNRLYGYFLSSPRIGDEEYVQALHSVVGRNNLIRHNVDRDPVPIALGKNIVSNNLSWLIPKLKELRTYEDLGYLFLETSSDVKRRIKNKNLSQDEFTNQAANISSYVHDQVQAIKNASNIKSFVDVVSEDVSKSKGLGKITKFFWSSTKEIVKRCFNCIKPAPKAIWDLASTFVTARVAHLHYGHDHADGRGAVFCSKIVGSGNELDVIFENSLQNENH